MAELFDVDKAIIGRYKNDKGENPEACLWDEALFLVDISIETIHNICIKCWIR